MHSAQGYRSNGTLGVLRSIPVSSTGSGATCQVEDAAPNRPETRPAVTKSFNVPLQTPPPPLQLSVRRTTAWSTYIHT